jgi:hypothetical protein
LGIGKPIIIKEGQKDGKESGTSVAEEEQLDILDDAESKSENITADIPSNSQSAGPISSYVVN